MSVVDGASTQAPPNSTPQPRGFTIGHQKLGLDLDFSTRSLKGWTEITIIPQDANLRIIKLNCRQSTITRILVNNKGPTSKHVDPFSKLKIHEMATVHQHNMLRAKLEPCLQDPLEGDLSIILPKSVKVELQDPTAAAARVNQNTRDLTTLVKRESPDGISSTPAPALRVDNASSYAPIHIVIEFVIDNFREGLHFVSSEFDSRYPHAYTTNTTLPGFASSIFPCIDSLWERYTWEIEITTPNTLGDIGRSRLRPVPSNARHNGPSFRDKDFVYEYKGEDSDLDMVAVCSGQFISENPHPSDPHKKTFKFMMATPTSPHHIAFAIGPFEKTTLTGESDEEENMGRAAVDVVAYCLPGRMESVKNTCLFMQKASDFFVRTYGNCPYQSFQLCFVDDFPFDTIPSASLAVCSNRLLFGTDMIDPIYPTTRTLTYALATQWSGVSMIPKEWTDYWVIIGIAYYITGVFLKKLTGNNEYRYRLKRDAEAICQLDVGRKPIFSQGWELPLSPDDFEFVALKAPMVLYILDRRLTKSSGSLGLARVVPKIFLNAHFGDMQNGALSTAHFIKVCEKVGHAKLESFFQQWVYGSGFPRFEISQRFNKKKLIVEMIIRQVQVTNILSPAQNSETLFIEAKEDKDGHASIEDPQLFTGPMTIRLHEADGTPYEHVVEIKEQSAKLEIPYMTKYKRIKRTKLQKERLAVTAGMDINADIATEDVLLYCLGDVLQTEEDAIDWRLVEWSKEEEEKMAQEAFEWIRVDADFEWICTLTINQPDHMFLSQLQQDRDVIAQYESIVHFQHITPSPVISSILVRTVMDRRYYYGIRTEAALALAGCARQDTGWIGQHHLQKAFQEFYCFPNSSIPRGNEFWDFTSYFVQLAIIEALSRIKEASGKTPLSVQQFLLDLLRYNDNSNNDFSDHYYVAALMKALQVCIATGESSEDDMNFDFEDDDFADASQAIISEIERIQRMDQWLPSYHNIISMTALDIKKGLVLSKTVTSDLTEFLAYTREGTSDNLRLKAFECLIELGALHNPAILEYICAIIGMDPSPFIRKKLLKLFVRGLGMIGYGQEDRQSVQQDRNDVILIEHAEVKPALGITNIHSALDRVKLVFGNSPSFKAALWPAVASPSTGVIEMRILLDICALMFAEQYSIVVRLKTGKPRRLICKHVGKGKLHFIWHPTPEQVATFLPTPASTPPSVPPKPVTISFKPLVPPTPSAPTSTPTTIKLKKEKSSKTKMILHKSASPPPSSRPTPPSTVQTPQPQAAPPKFKLKLKLKNNINTGIPSPDNIY